MQIQDDQAQRLSASLEALSERIGRLSIALNIKLDNQQAVQKLMEQPQIPFIEKERRTLPPDAQAGFLSMSGDRRASHLREELRGLLVLRFHLETVILNDNGLKVTQQIIKQAEDHLLHKGFKPGPDGLKLDDFFTAK
ncbi:hypothetical protein [Rhodoferax sp.]|uniref:hypothetical protein n=1 Tax=Rhodoferax sp. TaxID=50421 RepID=UPI00284D007D|nr:hypothetical protein [Rhodoferax sp.]MDR3370748.1 hypothetical protein [Rhodoferax sp.]